MESGFLRAVEILTSHFEFSNSFDESKHPREHTSHDGKKAGQFAEKRAFRHRNDLHSVAWKIGTLPNGDAKYATRSVPKEKAEEFAKKHGIEIEDGKDLIRDANEAKNESKLVSESGGTLRLSQAGETHAKSAIREKFPWTKRGDLRWQFEPHRVDTPGTDMTGTVSVFVTVGQTRFKISKLGREDQRAMEY